MQQLVNMRWENIPTIASLCAESQVTLPVSKEIVPFIHNLPLVLNPVLNDSLFFVPFNPAGTMLRRWYLITIDLASTKEIIGTRPVILVTSRLAMEISIRLYSKDVFEFMSNTISSSYKLLGTNKFQQRN